VPGVSEGAQSILCAPRGTEDLYVTRDRVARMDEENLRAHDAQRAQWMERAQQGDRVAYGALLTDVTPPILRFLSRRIADQHEREDVYQDTLMALHCARHTYDPSRPFEPWLFAIARHVLVDHFRRRGVQRSDPSEDVCLYPGHLSLASLPRHP
jgi:DNA-directed RNA polymerase specialized sigma24 family protein